MSLFAVLRLQQFQKVLTTPAQFVIQAKNYAGPGGTRQVKKPIKRSTAEKKILPVEQDVNKLLTYVCGSNIYKEGEDVKLKPDSEYPDWLWTLKTEPAKLEELDPNTKQYWRKVRKMGLRMQNKMREQRKF